MALSRIATAVGGLLLSKAGRRFAGRHAGKLALATLAFELWRQHRSRATPQAAGATPNPTPPPHPQSRPQSRTRWSGRRV
jgi:uncharacterized membrane protein YebE (DUF533 family)